MSINTLLGSRNYQKKFSIDSFTRDTKTQTYFELVLTFLTIIFFAWFALYPTAITISELVGDINNLRDVRDKMDDKINTLTASQTHYSSAKDRLALLEQALPEQLNLPEFIAQLEKIGEQSQVEVQSISFDDYYLEKKLNKNSSQNSRNRSKTSSNQWLSLRFNMSLDGDYYSIRRFLENISNLRRLVQIDNFSLTKQGQDDSQLKLTVSGQISYY